VSATAQRPKLTNAGIEALALAEGAGHGDLATTDLPVAVEELV
jgi:hypothetical protein